MSAKTVLVAHHLAPVRDRFTVALADARHESIAADTEAGAREAVGDPARDVHLVVADLTLAEDGIAFVRSLKHTSSGERPVVVFSGSVRSAADVPLLAALQVGYVNDHAATAQILPALAPHLFPDSFNRRVSSRVTIGVPVSYRFGRTIAGALTLDVGKGGVAIRTMSPVAKGETIQVRFRLPGAPNEIDAQGHVAWSDRNLGMGVQFDKVSSASQGVIDTFVDDVGEGTGW